MTNGSIIVKLFCHHVIDLKRVVSSANMYPLELHYGCVFLLIDSVRLRRVLSFPIDPIIILGHARSINGLKTRSCVRDKVNVLFVQARTRTTRPLVRFLPYRARPQVRTCRPHGFIRKGFLCVSVSTRGCRFTAIPLGVSSRDYSAVSSREIPSATSDN